MNHRSLKKNIVWLRICVTTFLLAILSLFLFSFTVSSRLVDDIWQQLGISQLEGTGKIKTSFLNNYFDYYGVRNVKNMATADRSALAKNLLGFTKQYVSGGAFKSEYEKLRMEARPAEPVEVVKTKEEIRKQRIEETKESIKNLEETMKKMDAEMKKAMQSAIDAQKDMLKDYEDTASQMIDIFYQGELMNRENNIRRYKEDLQQWEANYPADYKKIIKARLQKYLDIAKTVDFGAELVERNGKKYFVKQEYERKNDNWKMIYRAGKEVYDVARPFAESWLQEL